MVVGAIIGGIVGLILVIFTFLIKEQRFNKLLRSVKDPGLEYAALFHYASAKRFQKSFKFFDSYGMLFISGNHVYYKTKETLEPLRFNLAESKAQQEPNWRKLKWFSLTDSTGEKYYFDSHKMGAFVNNSDETLVALSKIQAKQSTL